MNNSSFSDEAKSIRAGMYKHFKGCESEVLGVAKHSETEEELVIYRHKDGEIWARPVAMFLETVDRDNYTGPRFVYVDTDSSDARANRVE